MLRFYLFFLAAVGLSAALLTGEGPSASSASDTGTRSTLIVTDAPSKTSLEELGAGSVILHRENDGHFYADVQVNGAPVRMLVDTGATAIALTRDDARKAGIGISIGMPNVVGQGASGDVKGEYITVDRISLGGKTAEAMNAVVLDGGGVSLLGQTFLSKFGSVEIHGDTMVLR